MEKYCYAKYLDNILRLVQEEKYNASMKHFEFYLKNYPKDINAQICYVDLLIKMGDFEEAEKFLQRTEIAQKNYLEHNMWLLLMIKLLCCKKKYKEAYRLLQNNPEILISKPDLKSTLLFLQKKLNQNIQSDTVRKNYLTSQIMDYSEELFMKHVIDNHFNMEDKNKILFTDDFPLYEVYDLIKKRLPHTDVIHSSPITEISYFKYDGCGRINYKSVDFIRVTAMSDSNQLITMFPYENKGITPYIDLNPFFLYENDLSRVKVLSQTEKFNQRYGKYFN